MQISGKFHRVTSLMGGIILIATCLLSLFLSLIPVLLQKLGGLATGAAFSVLTLIGQAMSIVMAVPLLVGKKNAVAGVLFLVAAAQTLLLSVGGNISILVQALLAKGSLPGYITVQYILYLIGNLLTVLWRVLIAVECFKPGVLSGKPVRFLLIPVPVLAMLMNTAAYAVLTLTLNSVSVAVILTTLLPVVILNLINLAGPVLACISASIPVWEALPVYYPPMTYRPY